MSDNDETVAVVPEMVSAKELAQGVIDNRPDLDGYTVDEAFEAGVHRAFDAIRATTFDNRTKGIDNAGKMLPL